MLEHKPAKVLCIVATLLVFIVTIVFNALASQPEYSSGIFKNTIGNISDEYPTRITPTSETFSIWSAIYVWMAVWLIYSQAAICIKVGGDYLYKDSAFMSNTFFFLYNVNLCLNIAWIILFDRIYFIVCLFVILFMVLSAYACIGMCSYSLAQNLDELSVQNLTYHVWLIRLFVQNGIGLYAGWITVATHINLDVALRYDWAINGNMSDMIALVVILVLIVCWYVLDLIALDRYTRYLITPHIVLVIASTGIFYNQVDVTSFDRTEILILTLLAVSSFGLLLKLIVMTCRHFLKDDIMSVA